MRVLIYENRCCTIRSCIIYDNTINVENDTPEQSCAFFGDQSQAINSLAATLMFINLQKILVTSELPPELITFNSSGYSTFEI